ncbi:ABC transporter permease [uncultured Subdoligranulum sp.]|uniref:ABC transporter permease n=1 Tax=uncultured Subdoligranulum sp. TaxID=512298 RepID=UPI002639C61E|nr:ABC transporter permease [uncultured Subdoligranulum sp.]
MNLELLLGATMRYSAPILLAAVGALFCDCAGITFIILEAQMLLACFFSVIAGYYFQSWGIGVLAAIAASVLLGWFFIWITMKMSAIELVVGFAINFLIDGLTVYLLRMVFHQTGSFVSPDIPEIPKITIPLLSQIPVIGSLFREQTWIVYAAFISVALAAVLIYRTAYGLHVLACGASPEAAKAVGISIPRTRISCIMIASVLCALAGSQLSIGFLSMFSEGMTVGKGYIALGALMFSNRRPALVLFITLLFGFAEAVGNQVQLQGTIASELVLMIPYLAVLACVFIRKPQQEQL